MSETWRKHIHTITSVLFVLGQFLLLSTIVLWYLAETGRLSIQGLEPINVGIAAIVGYLGALLGWLANKGERGRSDAQEWRNRKHLIQNVKAAWIAGVREQALYQSVWIELGMEAVPEQVERPWSMTYQPDPDTQPKTTNKDILTIFREQAPNALLILGEPGSGKTVTLLDLAQKLLDEAVAADDLVTPIPVVFNLSSWAQKRQALHEWLVSELDRAYGVPDKTARHWLETDALILLLDGLDEVAEAHREACVKAINAYRKADGQDGQDGQGLTGIVVCSRSKEYETLAAQEKLDLQGAVKMQPLTVARADAYLQQMGQELWAVRELLQEDTALHEWVQSPLFLYVVAIAYRGLSLEELRHEHNGTLDRLYDTYVTQMLQHHRPHQQSPYEPTKIRKWLAHLAGRLSERELTVYLIERMQPDWLGWRLAQEGRDDFILRGLKWLVGKSEIRVIDRQWSWPAVLNGTRYGVIFGLMGVGPVIGLVVGLLTGLFAGLGTWLVVGLGVGLVVGLFFGLVEGDVRSHEKPNQGVWRDLFFGMFVGLFSGLFGGLLGGLFAGSIASLLFGQTGGLIVGMVFWLFAGLFGGTIVSLFTGLGIFIRHFILRYLMAYYDYLPFRLVPFLEYAKERLLLRRVGGGYIFIHRTLQDYFAAQDTSFDEA